MLWTSHSVLYSCSQRRGENEKDIFTTIFKVWFKKNHMYRWIWENKYFKMKKMTLFMHFSDDAKDDLMIASSRKKIPFIKLHISLINIKLWFSNLFLPIICQPCWACLLGRTLFFKLVDGVALCPYHSPVTFSLHGESRMTFIRYLSHHLILLL